MPNNTEMDEINALLNQMRQEENEEIVVEENKVPKETTPQMEQEYYEEVNKILYSTDDNTEIATIPSNSSTLEDYKVNYSDDEEALVEKEVLDRISRGLGVPYSDEQRKIIRHANSPLNVISCAGSGKTSVLIAKMFYREFFYNIPPDNMLAITFNNKASYEIKSRYYEGRKLMRTHGSPEFKTYHALFLMLIRNIPKYRNLNVVNQEKYTFQLYRLIDIHDSGEIDKSDILTAMFSLRSYLINNGISNDGISNFKNNSKLFSEKNYIEVMTAYNEMKTGNNEIDFDDMMILLKSEIERDKNHKIISIFRSLYKDVYVDEYQDISRIQLEILDILIEDKNRLVVIGDDDQSSAKRYSISA